MTSRYVNNFDQCGLAVVKLCFLRLSTPAKFGSDSSKRNYISQSLNKTAMLSACKVCLRCAFTDHNKNSHRSW